MHESSQEALRNTAELNNTYRTPEEVRALMGKITGRHPDVTVLPGVTVGDGAIVAPVRW